MERPDGKRLLNAPSLRARGVGQAGQVAWKVLVPATIVLFVGLGVGAMFGAWFRTGAARPIARLSLLAPPGRTPDLPRISPDGKTVAFVGRDPGERESPLLFVRALADREARPVEGSVGVVRFAFDPTGKWLAFVAPTAVQTTNGLRLFKVPVDASGPPIGVQDWVEHRFAGLVWLDESTLITVTEAQPQRLLHISMNDGSSREGATIEIDDDGTSFEPRSTDPDGGRLFGTAHGHGSDEGVHGVALVDVATGQAALLLREGSDPVLAGPAMLLFSHEGELLAAQFKSRSRRIASGPVVLTDGLQAYAPGLAGGFDVARTGTLVYVPAGRPGTTAVRVELGALPSR